MNKLILSFLIVMTATSCTDAQRAQVSTYGSPGEITCYSGGKEIYHGKSTGKIISEKDSDGWYFSEEGSGQLIRVSADCIIRN